MTKALGDYEHEVVQFDGFRNIVRLYAIVDIGSSGAPTVRSGASDPRLSISHTSTGLYAVTAPACPAFGCLKVSVLKSTTLQGPPVGKTESPTTGAFTFNTYADDGTSGVPALADPASGDVLLLEYVGSMSKVT